jgi:predicted homoserine dehydrogenase-like protein
MIIVDTALAAREAERRPVRVGMLGAGFMARGIANQILNYSKGIRLAAISNRHGPRAIDCFKYADATLDPIVAESQAVLDDAIVLGRPVVTDD